MTSASRRAKAVGHRRGSGATQALWWVPPTALGSVVGYLGLLTVAAASARRTAPRPAAARRRRFAVLVPAHNEETTLADTLVSLDKLQYPRDLVSVHVIADHCSDATVEIASGFDVEVHEHVDEQRGKGPALSWAVDTLIRREVAPDAFVIIDADTVVDAGFLEAADQAMAAGATVVQGYYAVLDPGTSSATGFRAAALAVRHYVRPLGRCRIGGSAGLYGNGMVFAADVLQARPWTSHLTEDMELQLELLLDGTRVTFEPRAVVEAEMPSTLEASASQHARWEEGRLDLLRRFVRPLAGRAVRGGGAGRVAYVDALVDQAVPPLSVVAGATLAWWAVATARACVLPSTSARRQAALATAIAVCEGGILLSSLRIADAPKSAYTALLGAPKVMAWKVRLWARTLRGKQAASWTRTTRNDRGSAA